MRFVVVRWPRCADRVNGKNVLSQLREADLLEWGFDRMAAAAEAAGLATSMAHWRLPGWDWPREVAREFGVEW